MYRSDMTPEAVNEFQLYKAIVEFGAFEPKKNSYHWDIRSLGFMYLNGFGTKADALAALNLFKTSYLCRDMVSELMFDPSPETGLSRDPERALSFMLDEFNTSGRFHTFMVEIALSYLYTVRSRRNLSVAFPLLADSVLCATNYYYIAKGIVDSNWQLPRGQDEPDEWDPGWFIPDSESADANEQFITGCSYADGYFNSTDPIRAVEYFQKSASAGHVGSLLNLGECYELGLGVNPDIIEAYAYYSEALFWFKKAFGDRDDWRFRTHGFHFSLIDVIAEASIVRLEAELDALRVAEGKLRAALIRQRILYAKTKS